MGSEEEVTAADREKAAAIRWSADDFQGQIDAIAQALADERTKAREPFLALADKYAQRAVETNGWSITFRDEIRRAAEDSRHDRGTHTTEGENG